MAKRFTLRFSFPSLNLCRLKLPSSLPQNPSPAATLCFSPVNPKALDIAYPSVPGPPPSTPNHLLFKCQALPAKIIPVDCGCGSRRSRRQPNPSECDAKSPPEYSWREQQRPQHKLHNSSVSDVSSSDSETVPFGRPKAEKRKKEFKASVCRSSSFSTEGNESEIQLLSSTSFDSSYDFVYSNWKTIISERNKNGVIRKNKNKSKKKKKKNLKVRKLERDASNNWKSGEKTKAATTPENASPEKAWLLRRLMPCAAEGLMVKESFAVVKRSEDPYEDFKRSMLEMILEKLIFDVKDLEQLLQCFLSLNSPQHHPAIVQAFTEVWEVLFCKSPNSYQQRD